MCSSSYLSINIVWLILPLYFLQLLLHDLERLLLSQLLVQGLLLAIPIALSCS